MKLTFINYVGFDELEDEIFQIHVSDFSADCPLPSVGRPGLGLAYSLAGGGELVNRAQGRSGEVGGLEYGTPWEGSILASWGYD